MNKKKYTFAISIRDDITAGNLFTNGISQNIIFLADLFALMGHKVVLLVNTKRQNKQLRLMNDKSYALFTAKELSDKKQHLDIVFEVGHIIPANERKFLLALGAKLVSIHCGNQLIMDMETLLYTDGKDSGLRHIPEHIEQVWIIPQHEHQLTYMEVLTGAKVSVCPCIWNPFFLSDKHKKTLTFRETPNIYVMEPNLSVVKNALIPLAIIESMHRKKPDAFHKAYIVNGIPIQQHPYFLNNIARNFHSVNSKITPDKVYFTPRAGFNDVFTHYDVLLSHHWRNALNYLSFEALYYNIPFVHNSEPMKATGYFYPDFDIRLGTDALQKALSLHKLELKDHEQRNKVFLETISILNKDVQEKYASMINDVIFG